MFQDWSIRFEQENPLQPRFEKNAPDMYIPSMAFLTYVVMASMVLCTQGKFVPEQLHVTASSSITYGIIELIIHCITLYLMQIETSLRILDVLAYCSYKFVGMNAALLMSLMFSRYGYYLILMYFSGSFGFFLMRSLNHRIVPEGSKSYSFDINKRRLHFILFIASVQPILMWWLSHHLI